MNSRASHCGEPCAPAIACASCEDRLRAFNDGYRKIDELYHRVAKSMGFSDSAFEVFYALYLNDGCQQKDICCSMFVSKQTINSSIKVLREKGLVRLEAGRGRNVFVFLTEEGHRLAQGTVARVIEAERRALMSLTPEEWRAYQHASEALHRNLVSGFQSLMEAHPAQEESGYVG